MARSEAPEQHQDVCTVMCNRTRLRIAEILYERVEVPYSELATLAGVSESLLNHHLKKMNGLVEKGRQGYRLTARGRSVYKTIQQLTASLQHPEPPRQAPLTRRMLAFLVDVLVFFTATGAILDPHMIASLATITMGILTLDTGTLWQGLTRLVERSLTGYSNVFFAAYIFMTLLEAYNGQTLGKHLFKLRAVRQDGSKLTLVESGIRNAGKIFILPVDLALGLLLYHRQGYIKLTDYIVKAKVIDESNTHNRDLLMT